MNNLQLNPNFNAIYENWMKRTRYLLNYMSNSQNNFTKRSKAARLFRIMTDKTGFYKKKINIYLQNKFEN